VVLASSNNLNINHNEEIFEEYKNSIKKEIMSHAKECSHEFLSYRAIEEIDSPSNFFCNKFVTKIEDLPTTAELNLPWSAYYWAIKRGGLSARYGPYNSEAQKNLTTWKDYVNSYSQPKEHNTYYNTKNWDYMVNKIFSPSEKYDLLVGDLNYTLTNKMKEEGQDMAKDENGDVPGWMGKCHGWTPASINEPRPIKTVNITAADGKTVISFYPEDIKGLASIFWASTSYDQKFIGARCKYKDLSKVPKDPETGLWDTYQCFTVNPASLVIVLANQIGIRKKHLIYDPDSNGQIWNQPVYGYTLKYFNPITNEYGKTNSVKVSMASFIQKANTTKFDNFF